MSDRWAEAAIADLARGRGYCGQVTAVHVLPPREPRVVPVPDALHPAVRRWLAGRGIEGLWSHQAEAARLVADGRDVVLSTATASGKTLAFLVPLLDALASDPDACAMFLYPLKALANDQLEVLRQAEAATGLDLAPALYDGDTPRTRRPRIRQTSRAILTNPYEVHETLPYHAMWRRVFANLRFLVIDEAHRYTGVFGSNVAQVIRRLLRVAEAYGSRPRVVLASASIANPGEHAERLTSRPCAVVDDDGSGAGERRVVFWNAAVEGAGSPHVQTRDVFASLVRRGLKTLCFTLSRKTAELVASLAMEAGRGERLPVAPYRAGYLPEDRRAIEQGFRDGSLRGLVSTEALELGIDIGDLDAVVISGYPGAVSSFWQQAGRAGRRGGESLAVYVAFDGIVDQYLLKHPDLLLSRTFERATVDLGNEHIVAGHMLCAASELPVAIPEGREPERGIAHGLAGSGLLHETPMGFVYAGIVRPHEAVRLDRIGDRTVALVDADDEELLETIDFDRALREVFPGAVYLHQARTWVVEALDLAEGTARLRRKDVDHYTQALQSKTAEILSTRDSRPAGPALASIGRIRMTHKVRGYLVKRYDRVVGGADLDMPERAFETSAVWLDVPPPAGRPLVDLLGGLHGLEHAIVGLAPLVLSCDPADLAGFSTLVAPHGGGPAIFVYDGHEGGIGLADRAWEDLTRLLGTAADLLSTCPCESGCPACCLSPSCGNDNQPMDKALAAELARSLASGLGRARPPGS
jgi:DEAD/DEAH box helicase domain-containing protein